ncbi:MAG: helix-turn-helix domain-containing protein [Polyangiaceae bacterium]|nr:helix-turn-helix domain-containing protein [Polyangiaceae bacterium]
MQSEPGRLLLSENVRYCLWKDPQIGPDQRKDWARRLAERAGTREERVLGLFDGDDPADEEIRSLADALGRSEEELRYTDLAAEEETLTENLRYLLGTVEHGGQRRLAEEIGVKDTTVFRWKQGTRPRERQLRALIRALGLPPHTDLERDRIYLSFRPVTLRERHAYIHELIDQLSPDELTELMPALERMLKRR